MKKKPMCSVPDEQGPNRQMLRRALLLMAVCGAAAFALLLAKLCQIQLLEHDFYEQRALEQQLREAPSSPRRGSITDARGRLLAVSASVDNVYLSPAEIRQYGEDRELIARELSRILDLDYEELLEKTGQTGSWYVTAARKVERETADAIRAFKTAYGIRGVRLEPDTRRYYPNAALACHLIGFVGMDNTGLEGIEARYDSSLQGSAGRSLRSTNAFGTELLFESFEDYEPGEDGCDVVLSLDAAVQFMVEKHLRQAVEDYDIQNGAGAICMDVNTGAILAMASLDGYDLNHFLDVSDEVRQQMAAAGSEEEAQQILDAARARQWRNKALSDTYEPGSTFKIITLSMALEEGVVDLSSSFYCGGSVSVKGRTSPIRCWKTEGHGSQNLTQAVQHSCNAAFVNIGLRMGPERFYDYCEAFGFLQKTGDPEENLTAKTGIDLAGESGSIWWSENVFCSPRNQSQLAAASFGQTFTITPLQLITAVSACVNGGRLMRPYVVQRILNPDGSVKFEHEPEMVRQVIRPETSEKVRSILEQVVGDNKEGTGRNAAVAGYRIGGKTGTSEKVSLEARPARRNTSSPSSALPRRTIRRSRCWCFWTRPRTVRHLHQRRPDGGPGGGEHAGGHPPLSGRRAGEEERKATPPRCRSWSSWSSPRPAARLQEAGLQCERWGRGPGDSAQLPKAGTAHCQGSQVILYLGTEPGGEQTVPDLNGLSLEQARAFWPAGCFCAAEALWAWRRTGGLSERPAGSRPSSGEIDHGDADQCRRFDIGTLLRKDI